MLQCFLIYQVTKTLYTFLEKNNPRTPPKAHLEKEIFFKIVTVLYLSSSSFPDNVFGFGV